VKETFKKGIFAGLGFIGFSYEKAKEAVEALVERGELSAEQGRKVLDEMVERGRKDSQALSENVEKKVHETIEKLPLVSKARVEELEKRVKKLEKLDRRVSALEKAAESDEPEG